jgi:biopolymer transport protein ExbD
MNLKTRNKLDIDFETSSLTDIVFLLLIFFMLTSADKVHESIQVTLPSSETSDVTHEFLSVTITKDLVYYVSGEAVDFFNIKNLLSIKMPASKNILVQADESVPINYVIKVCDLVNSLGANLSIATTKLAENN